MDGGVSVRPPPNYGPPRFSGPSSGIRQPFGSPGGSGGHRMSGPPQSGGYHGYRTPMAAGPSVAYDGKRIRNKSVLRKTVDFNTACINYIGSRLWQRDFRDSKAIQTDELYIHDLLPPPAMVNTPMNCVTSRFVRNSMNKFRCPIFCVCWTPEGRRLITGASSGEFTLWNGLTFNFETILQAHDSSVRCMTWSHNDQWMLTADHGGYVKYWQTNMNNVKMYQAHKEAVRGVRWAVTLATGTLGQGRRSASAIWRDRAALFLLVLRFSVTILCGLLFLCRMSLGQSVVAILNVLTCFFLTCNVGLPASVPLPL